MSTPIRKNVNAEDSLKDVEMAPLMTNTTGSSISNAETPTSSAARAEAAADQAALSKVLYACGMYSFCSVSMVLTNKSLASR
jgi:hypothetical protein